jgi:hypothetical protein
MEFFSQRDSPEWDAAGFDLHRGIHERGILDER